MSRFSKYALVSLAALVLVLGSVAHKINQEIDKSESEDPTVWEEDIQALEAGSQGRYGAGEAVIFVGSSSIRLWRSLEADMAPIPVLQHGFGGAKLNDVVYYAERLVSQFSPRAVVVFAGTNDLHPGRTKPPTVLLQTYQQFVERVRADDPALPIYFIAITPSLMRWEIWELAQETNRLVTQWSSTQNSLYVIDTGAALLGGDGSPDPQNYIFDGLHLSAEGYRIWTSLIKPPLLRELGLNAAH